jgi:hypothetical protein
VLSANDLNAQLVFVEMTSTKALRGYTSRVTGKQEVIGIEEFLTPLDPKLRGGFPNRHRKFRVKLTLIFRDLFPLAYRSGNVFAVIVHQDGNKAIPELC